MILHLEDWEKYPDAVLHLGTTNETFLKVSKIYKAMGIENHAFMLALHDPSLYDVDPRDPTLTIETRIKIAKEVKENPWYYLREIVVAPSSSGLVKNRFKANRFNMAFFWVFFNNVTSLNITIRQAGKSFAAETLVAGIINFWTFNTKVNALTKDTKLRTTNIQRIKNIIAEFPKYLQMRTKKDSDNTENITINSMGNKYTSAIGRTNEADANNVFRGETSPIFFSDETCFTPNISISVAAALAAGTAARDAARKNGELYGTVFTTTAGKKNTKSGMFGWNLYNNGAKWTEKFLDIGSKEKLQEVVQLNSKGNTALIIIEFNHRQLGFTDEWLKQAISEAMSNGEDAEADFLNKWGNGNASSAIPTKIIDRIKKNVIEPLWTEITESGYVVRWYKEESVIRSYALNRQLVMGLDTSDAVGADGIGLVITDLITGETLGVGDYNETNLILFSEFIHDMLIRFNKILLIAERRSSAATILANLELLLLKDGVDPFKKIFNWVVQESRVNEARFEYISGKLRDRPSRTYDALRKHLGFATAGSGKSSRDKLYGSGLLACAKYTGHVMFDNMLVSQLAGLVLKNGRVDHKAGDHDDLVIAKMLTWWFLNNAENVSFYGLREQDMLSGVDTGEKNDTKKTKEEIDKEEKLRSELSTLESIDLGNILPMEKLQVRSRIFKLKSDLAINNVGLNILRKVA